MTDEALPMPGNLGRHRHELDKLGEGLLEYETLTGDEIKRLLAGEEVRGDHDNDRPATPMAAANLRCRLAGLHAAV